MQNKILVWTYPWRAGMAYFLSAITVRVWWLLALNNTWSHSLKFGLNTGNKSYLWKWNCACYEINKKIYFTNYAHGIYIYSISMPRALKLIRLHFTSLWNNLSSQITSLSHFSFSFHLLSWKLYNKVPGFSESILVIRANGLNANTS